MRLMDIRRMIRPIINPTIADQADLKRYVVTITMLALAVTWALDVPMQLIFFISWSAAARSWILDVAIVTITAVPIATMIGRTQRDLLIAKRAFEDLSRTDPLTGLPNRRALMETAERAETIVLVIVDIDRFKQVNDTYGHRMGDHVIKIVGQTMASVLGPCAMVSRLGGEEFAALAPLKSLPDVLSALVTLREVTATTPMLIDGTALTVTISAGVAAGDQCGSFDRLYGEADEALYRAKEAGRNRIELSPVLARYRQIVQRQAA